MYLEDEDPVQGEAYINRAAQLQTQTKDDNLQIIYKVCQGRVFDYKRKFIEAASRQELILIDHTVGVTVTKHQMENPGDQVKRYV